MAVERCVDPRRDPGREQRLTLTALAGTQPANVEPELVPQEDETAAQRLQLVAVERDAQGSHPVERDRRPGLRLQLRHERGVGGKSFARKEHELLAPVLGLDRR